MQVILYNKQCICDCLWHSTLTDRQASPAEQRPVKAWHIPLTINEHSVQCIDGATWFSAIGVNNTLTLPDATVQWEQTVP